MGFSSSIWLLSIAAISIPVLIHLWNVRPGKTLKVGSIALIKASSRKRSRSFKLLDILLLLLRCLLLVMLAFVLALPYIKQKDINTGRSWLLIPKENFKEAYQKFKPKADSLIKAGYELHYFNDGFKKVVLQQALADTAALANTTPYWDLLQQIDRSMPTPQRVYIITPGLLNKFSGDRPNVSLKLNWQTYTPADSVTIWIKKAWFTANKDVHLVTAASQPSGVFSRSENLSTATGKNSVYDINISGGKAVVNLKNGKLVPIEVDTTSIKIDVLADTNPQDANYVEAALQTAAQFSQRNIEVQPYDKNSSAKKDWLFWLSDKSPGNEVFNHYQNILIYEGGKVIPVNTWMNTANANGQTIPLYKSINPGGHNAQTLWKDGFGDAVLTSEAKGNTKLYHFYTHFNPAWNNLVWDSSFPLLMQQLITPSNQYENSLTTDNRVIDNKQLQPTILAVDKVRGTYHLTTNLSHYFWLLLVLLFVLERWLAHKKTEGVTG